jgi:hypothetical protein
MTKHQAMPLSAERERSATKARHGVWPVALLATALLSGCAALNQVNTEVTSFAQWPAQRAASSYAYDRLPSQQARADDQTVLEAAAAQALKTAGFSPAADADKADVVVQLGARISRVPGVWDDLYGWPYGYGVAPPWAWRLSPRWGYWGPRGGTSLGFSWGAGGAFGDLPRFEREVALVIRDRASGKALYETRAASEGGGGFTPRLMTALFEASMQGFPNPPTGPRPVQVSLPASPAAPKP